MKKIMIAVVAVAMAVAAKAASITWSSLVTDGDGTPVDIAAFCDAEGNPYTKMPTGVSIVLATITGDLASDFSVVSVIATSEIDTLSGSMVVGSYDAGYSSSFPFKNGDVLAVVAAITDDKGVSYSALEYVADGSKVTDTFAVTGLTGDDWYGDFYFATKGNFTAVPEPTSGLMLLLGMAGLALRRKQK